MSVIRPAAAPSRRSVRVRIRRRRPRSLRTLPLVGLALSGAAPGASAASPWREDAAVAPPWTERPVPPPEFEVAPEAEENVAPPPWRLPTTTRSDAAVPGPPPALPAVAPGGVAPPSEPRKQPAPARRDVHPAVHGDRRPPKTPLFPRARPLYLVRAGDTLWDLARGTLGTDDVRRISRYWPRIHRANRDVIGPNPDLIHPGQRLRLPSE